MTHVSMKDAYRILRNTGNYIDRVGILYKMDASRPLIHTPYFLRIFEIQAIITQYVR